MHRLLERQLKRALGVKDAGELARLWESLAPLEAHARIQEGLAALLERVDQTYAQQERDLALRNRSLELSTDELVQANGRLREAATTQAAILQALRSTANALLESSGLDPLPQDETHLQELPRLMAGLVEDWRRARRELEQQKFALDEHAIVSVTDLEGTILYANDRFCEVSGYPREALLGTNHRVVRSGCHEAAFYQDMWHTIRNGRVWHGEICNRARAGHLYWVSATIVPILDEDGRPGSYIAIRTDITAQKRLEAQLQEQGRFMQSLTDTMGEGVYALDAGGTCRFLNPEGQRLLGWTVETLAERSFHDTVHAHGAQGQVTAAQDCPILLAIQQGRPFQSEGEVFTHRDGHRFPVFLHAVPQWQEGRVVGQVAVFQDISRRKAEEQALREARDRAEAASQAKSDFLANMSHEIRTPMNAVLGLTHLVLETELTDLQRSYLTRVDASARGLLGILNDILDFSRIEAGRLPVERVPFPLEDLLVQVASLVGVPAFSKGLELLLVLDPQLPREAMGDALRVGQVLTNLAGNAVKFTQQGRVRVVLSRVAGGLELAVHDTGIGLTETQLGRLFQPFTQADTSTTRTFGGTGLGLAISRRLVDLMGGELQVESRPGVGSCFRAVLPLEPAPTPVPPDPLPGRPELLLACAHPELRGLLEDLASALDLPWRSVPDLEALLAAHHAHPAAIAVVDGGLRRGAPNLANTLAALPHPPRLMLLLPAGEPLPTATPSFLALEKPVLPASFREALRSLLAPPAPRPSARPRAASGLEGRRVLLVEDHPLNRLVATQLLVRLGIQVTVAEGGAEALEALESARQAPFDLVLMDVQMPGMDGYETCQRLRQAGHGNLPVIALTAHAMSGERERCQAAGMDDHLAKPIDVAALQAALRRWMPRSGTGPGSMQGGDP